jgi:hypothetical protein
MLPLILVAVGAYLIGDSVLEDKKSFSDGGEVNYEPINFPTSNQTEESAKKWLNELIKEKGRNEAAKIVKYNLIGKNPYYKYNNIYDQWLSSATLNEKYTKGGKTQEKLAEYLVTLTNENGFEDDVVVMAKSEDDALYQAEKIKGYESSENGVVMLTDFDGKKIEYKKGGKTQGGMMAKGGYVTDLDEVVSSSDLKEELESKMKKGDEIVAFSYTNYGGTFFDKVAIEYFKENHPKNIVFEQAAYNGQNAIVFGEVAKDFLEETKDYPLGYEDMESFYYEMQNKQEEKDFKLFLSDIKNKYTVKKGALDWLLENKSGYYSIQTDGLDFSYSELENELEQEGLIKRKKMADGGMMAKGGKLVGKQKKLDVNKNGKLDAEDFKMLRGEKMAKGGGIKRPYRLGDKWRTDFDYEGMLKQGLKSKASWGESKLQKLYDSFEDVNYHTANKHLGEAIDSLKKSNMEEAEKHIELFHKDVKVEMEEN